MEIKTVVQLKELFKSGILKKADFDIVIFDKGECELMTEKDYTFSMMQSDIAWTTLENLGIPVSDA